MLEGAGQGTAVLPAAFCCIPAARRRTESRWKERRAQTLSVWAACGPGSLHGEPARQLWPGAVGPACVGFLWDLWDHATFSGAVATR